MGVAMPRLSDALYDILRIAAVMGALYVAIQHPDVQRPTAPRAVRAEADGGGARPGFWDCLILCVCLGFVVGGVVYAWCLAGITEHACGYDPHILTCHLAGVMDRRSRERLSTDRRRRSM